MLLREQIITEVSQHLQLTKDDYEIFKYGFMIYDYSKVITKKKPPHRVTAF